MSRPAKVIIHLDALRHNLQQIKILAPHSAVLAMVKANGYGHGIEQIALSLPEADAFGVACMEEGLQLRQAGVRNTIVLMEGLFAGNELSTAVTENFTVVVHHESQLQMLESDSPSAPLSVWLKIDTGMHRLGFAPSQARAIYQRLANCPAVNKPIVLMTHFATADLPNHSQTLQQIALFNQTTAGLSGLRSLCNSAGILAWPAAQFDWVRPGLMLYGISPFLGQQGVQHQLRPVMSLQSELIATQLIAPGEPVGYGGAWICPEAMRIGIVAIGYGDGYPQFAKQGTPLLVNGQRCPLIGRVSMDMSIVDLRSQAQAKAGDSVVLWGEKLPIEEVAAGNQTSAYELLTRVTQRVRAI
jgi:alanine racemase